MSVRIHQHANKNGSLPDRSDIETILEHKQFINMSLQVHCSSIPSQGYDPEVFVLLVGRWTEIQ